VTGTTVSALDEQQVFSCGGKGCFIHIYQVIRLPYQLSSSQYELTSRGKSVNKNALGQKGLGIAPLRMLSPPRSHQASVSSLMGNFDIQHARAVLNENISGLPIGRLNIWGAYC
jgi:hypothetical protein